MEHPTEKAQFDEVMRAANDGHWMIAAALCMKYDFRADDLASGVYASLNDCESTDSHTIIDSLGDMAKAVSLAEMAAEMRIRVVYDTSGTMYRMLMSSVAEYMHERAAQRENHD